MKQNLPPQVPPRPTQVKIGRVVSDKMDKTRVVEVNTFRRHPLYGQVQRRTKRYFVHDELNHTHVGDEVRFCLCRPLSRHKSWILMEVTRPSRGRVRLEEENIADLRPEGEEVAALEGDPAPAAQEGGEQ